MNGEMMSFKRAWVGVAVSTLLASFAAWGGCSSPGPQQEGPARGPDAETPLALVLKYSDFGPQAMAYETLGFDWYQWEATGGPDPSQTYDIRVVVFKGLSLEAVKTMYPVDRDKAQDYRYIRYEDALTYLNNNIKDLPPEMPALAKLLETTRQNILAHF